MLALALPHAARNLFMYWNELAGGAAQGPRGLCRRPRRTPFCPGANQPIESLAETRCGLTCPVLVSATRILGLDVHCARTRAPPQSGLQVAPGVHPSTRNPGS